MNPNSTHQLWSRWTTTITVPFRPVHATDLFHTAMRDGVARWYRKQFGSATELRIDRQLSLKFTKFIVDCRTEGVPANDPVFRQKRMDDIAKFFGSNLKKYGKMDVHIDIRIEAGDPGTGEPPSQLIIAPPIVDEDFAEALAKARTKGVH